MVRLIINTFGEDKPGLVSDISGIVYSLNGNILESKMVRLENIFTIIFSLAKRCILFQGNIILVLKQ